MTAFDELLKAAFEAGIAHYASPSTTPTFDEWRESISGGEPDLGPVRRGDLIEITDEKRIFDRVRGKRFIVSEIDYNFYRFVHDGELWNVRPNGAKKVRP